MNKKIKIIILVFIIFINSVFITGCWNYREIEQMAIVSGLAIDKKGDKYEITVEVINPESGQGLKMNPNMYTAEGNTIFDAVRNMITTVGKKLYWSHAKVIVVSENVAKEGVLSVLDFITRDGETRSNIWLLVSKEKTAKEVLRGKSEVDESLAFHIEDMLNIEQSISKYHGVELWNFINDLSNEGIAPTLPIVRKFKTYEEIVPKVFGTAVFKKDKMVGSLTGQETKKMLMIKDQLKGGLIVVRNIGEEGINVSLEVLKSKTKVKSEVIDHDIVMNIQVKMDVEIGEIAGDEDFISKKGREKLKKEAEGFIKKDIEYVIKKVQREYQSDIFGFGSIIQREMPDLWKKIKQDWTEIFSNLETKVSVEVNIKGSALTSKPIKIGD
ncbi:Ger(x)C family spore germination protein [Lutibacter sp. B2]|nr:Ger(x)C family spore germination protein [Lutibacter sp. B2]